MGTVKQILNWFFIIVWMLLVSFLIPFSIALRVSYPDIDKFNNTTIWYYVVTLYVIFVTITSYEKVSVK